MDVVLGALLFTMRMSMVGQVPPHYALVTYTVAAREGVDPDTLGALLISEQSPGSYDADEVRANGPTGLYQVMPMWAGHFGHDTSALLDPQVNTEVAAGIVRYSIERHERCSGRHDWRAHWKCSREGRHTCAAHVRPLLATEGALRSLAPLRQATRWLERRVPPFRDRS